MESKRKMNWYRKYLKFAQTDEVVEEDVFDFFRDIPANPTPVETKLPEIENWMQKYKMANPVSPESLNDFMEENNITGIANIKDFLKANGINFEELKLKDNILLVIFMSPTKEQRSYCRTRNPYIIDDFDYPEMETADSWLAGIYDHSLSNYVDFDDWNKTFWDEADDLKLYHATEQQYVENIKKRGLMIGNKTRGMSNQWTGSAVFASENPDELSVYGDALFEIDVGAMKKDGYMPTVNKEESIEESKMREKLANLIGIEDFDATSDLSSDGIWDSTWVIFGNIPAKYIKLVE